MVHEYRIFSTALDRINARCLGDENGGIKDNPFKPFPDFQLYGMANAIIHHGAHYCHQRFCLNEDTITQYIIDDMAVQNTLTQLGKLFPEALQPDSFSDPTLDVVHMPSLANYTNEPDQIGFFRQNIDLLWTTKQKQAMLVDILPDLTKYAITNDTLDVKKIKAQATNVDFMLGNEMSPFPDKMSADSGKIRFNF